MCVRRCPTGTSPRADFTCDCPPGFTGSMCDTAIDFCRPNPCNNSGTCQSSSSGFNCSCPANFTGNTCEIRIDPCRENPCINSLPAKTTPAVVHGTTSGVCPSEMIDVQRNAMKQEIQNLLRNIVNPALNDRT